MGFVNEFNYFYDLIIIILNAFHSKTLCATKIRKAYLEFTGQNPLTITRFNEPAKKYK